MRIELFGDEVEAIRYVGHHRRVSAEHGCGEYLPGKRCYSKDRLDSAINAIRLELRERLDVLNGRQVAGSPGAGATHQVRPGDVGSGGLLQWGGELRPTSGRAGAWNCA